MILETFEGKDQKEQARKYTDEVNDKVRIFFTHIRNSCEILNLEFIHDQNNKMCIPGFDSFQPPYAVSNARYNGANVWSFLEWFGIHINVKKRIVNWVSDSSYLLRFRDKKTNLIYAWNISDLSILNTENKILFDEFENILSQKLLRLTGKRYSIIKN